MKPPRSSHGTRAEALKAGLAILSDELRPQEIEEESFRFIESLVNLKPYPAEVRTVVRRVIHATGDPAWIKTFRFHPRAVETGVRLLREGCDVVVDVEMLRAAINQRRLSRLGGRVLCGLSYVPEVPSGKTRTEAALEKVLSENPRIGIVAVGNAPTALLAAIRFLQKDLREVLIVGLPVGFVKAAEAKLLLLLQDRPYITNLGPRGGSAATAAVVNALINLAHGQTAT